MELIDAPLRVVKRTKEKDTLRLITTQPDTTTKVKLLLEHHSNHAQHICHGDVLALKTIPPPYAPNTSYYHVTEDDTLLVLERWADVFGTIGSVPDGRFLPSMRRANAAVQVNASTVDRVVTYLADVLLADVVGVAPPPAKHKIVRSERLVLLAAPSPARLLEQVCADLTARRFVSRWYTLGSLASTLQNLADAVASDVTDVPSVRLEGFPSALCPILAQQLTSRGVELDPASTTLVSFAFAYSVYMYGIARTRVAARFSGAKVEGVPATADADTSDDAVCRAFYKLREATLRGGIDLRGRALDVGASPGGWTSYLARTCSHVIAVDPGIVSKPADAPSCTVEILNAKIVEALPLLAARGERLDAYVCDMNVGPGFTLDAFEATLPLLVPGAAVVLTLKNVFQRQAGKWKSEVEEALERLRRHADDVRCVHLLANTKHELTVTGHVRALAGGAQPPPPTPPLTPPPSPPPYDYKRDQALQKRLADEVSALAKLPGNAACADCGATRTVRFVSVKLGVFLCNRCYGVHRAVGAHVTRGKCIGLDLWVPDEVELLRRVGNINARALYEASVPPDVQRPTSASDDRAVERWIRDKYEKRLYAGASSERGAAETSAPSSAPAAVSAALRSAEPAPLIDFG